MTWTLVTGASQGLGKAIAKKLAESGLNLIIHYRKSEKAAHELVLELQEFPVSVEVIQGDFTDKNAREAFIKELLERFPNIKNLINNAGPHLIKKHLETTMEEWENLFDVNFFTPIFLSKALTPSLIKNKGSIINIGVSGINSFQTKIKSPAYSITKSALFAFTKSFAKELAEKGVRVNMVSPGYLENAIDLPSDLDKIPMKRAGTLLETADMVDFLLSEKASYITGQNIEVAGAVNL